MKRDRIEQILKGVLRSVSASVPGASSLAQAWSELDAQEQEVRIRQLEVGLSTFQAAAPKPIDYDDPFQIHDKDTVLLLRQFLMKTLGRAPTQDELRETLRNTIIDVAPPHTMTYEEVKIIERELEAEQNLGDDSENRAEDGTASEVPKG